MRIQMVAATVAMGITTMTVGGCVSVPGMTSAIPGAGASSADTKQICDSLRGSLDAGAPAMRKGKIDTMKKYNCPDTPAT